MDTLELQCGNCNEVMAVSTEHLGMQVECPHCNEVVQVPSKSELDPDAPDDEESIMTPPQSDDLFGETPPERLEMPSDPKLPRHRPAREDIEPDPPRSDPRRADPRGSDPRMSEPRFSDPRGKGQRTQDDFAESDEGDGEKVESGRGRRSSRASRSEGPDSNPFGAPPADVDSAEHEEEPHDEVAQFGNQIRRPKESMLVPILLIFLIPYCIATTGFVAWLIYAQNKYHFDPMERLPDPAPGEAPRQIQHDLKLPKKLLAGLGEAVTVGDLQVTPLKVEQTPDGDLMLSMKMRNISEKLAFKPMSDVFCRPSDEPLAGKIYTFLNPASDEMSERIYGGYLDFELDPPAENLFNGELMPGQEMIVHLTTQGKYRARAKKIADNPQQALWRVHVRRGLVSVRGEMKSATAVVGIPFNTQSIQKQKA